MLKSTNLPEISRKHKGGSVQPGVDAALSRQRSSVQIRYSPQLRHKGARNPAACKGRDHRFESGMLHINRYLAQLVRAPDS